MKKACYTFTIDVITIKNGAISGHEYFPYIVDAGSYEKARAAAADYGQTIVRMYASHNTLCYYRVTNAN